MPGVPSGKACNACRKQKKKCDEVVPTCSRCKRLAISCIGSGKRRFKFKDQNQRFTKSAPNSQRSIKSPISDFLENPDWMQPIIYVPSNEQTRLTLAFLDTVKVSTNLKYSLSWAYGVFLANVPKRFGTSKALDTASRALIASHSCYSMPGRIMSPQALSEYSNAISALRTSLDDPTEARSTNTLCAVNILLITQGFIGVTGNSPISHCQGAAQILKARGIRCKTEDKFEGALFAALRGPVLFEGLFNRKINFTRQEWDRLVNSDFDEKQGTGLMMQCLARVPDIVYRGRKAFKAMEFEQLSVLCDEVQDIYDSLMKCTDELRGHYRATPTRSKSPFTEISDQVFSARLYAHWQRTYGLALTITMFFNCILRSIALLPNENDTLSLEAVQLVTETIAVAEDAVIFRPLGSSYIILCLVAAWGCTSDLIHRSRVEILLEEYLSDFPRRPEQTEFDIGIVERQFNLRREEYDAGARSINSGGYRIC